MPGRSDPARLGRWLLRLRAGAARRAEVEDDLVELFRLRVEERGQRYAQARWLLDAASIRPPRRPAAIRTSGDHAMQVLWQDLRTGVRALAAQPRFTAVAALVIALGVGATTAVFSVVNAVLLRPLPYPESDRLVAVTGLLKSPTRTQAMHVIALADMAKWRPHAASFDAMGAFAYTELPIQVGDRAFAPVTALMDPEFLPTLGTPLLHGSYFPPAGAPGSEDSAIVSHALWVEAFGDDPGAVGRTISVNGRPTIVRGVLPGGFQFPRSDASYFTKPVDLLLPAAAVPGFPATSTQWFGIARLKPGAAIERAEAELQGIAEGLSRAPERDDFSSVQLAPLDAETTRRSRDPLLIVLASSIVLLLIASSNLMNLFFARGVGRLREMSIRRALGSTTPQLVRLLLVESLLLAAAGGVLGVALAALAIRGIVTLLPVHLPVTRAIDIDGTVLAFTVLLCAGTAIAAGLLPALHVTSRSSEAVRGGGLRTTAGRGVGRVQQTLCVAQIALGMALLACASLLAHSLWRLNTIDPGFATDGVLGFTLSVPGEASRPERARFYTEMLDEIRALPGVARAGFISFLPPETRAGTFMGVGIEGAPPPAPGTPVARANTQITSVDYFTTMRMTLIRGRDFTAADSADRPPVVVVNQTFARLYLADGEPLGRRIGTGFDGLKPMREIVGVVADTHDRGVAREPYPTIYLPLPQFNLGYGAVVVRTAGSADALEPAIRERVRTLNPAVPLTDFQMLDDRLRESLREPRFFTLLAATCAGLAVLFVAFGLSGLISYSVGRRTTELGIRMAIGAQRAAIVRMVLGQGLRMAVAGVMLGLGIAMVSSRALASLLYGVEPADLPTFAAAGALVLVVTLVSCYGPARRAGRVDPITVLRE